MENPKFIIGRCVELLLVLVWITSCSNSNKILRPINSFSKGDGRNISNDITIESIKKTRNTMKNDISSVTAFSILEQAKIQTVHLANNIKNPNLPLCIQNNHLYQSREYRNIPRGSYMGSDTYIVKRGDTLFYISWITGNTFQDLAKLNGIRSPEYKLQVGQTLYLNKRFNPPIKRNDFLLSKSNLDRKHSNNKFLNQTNTIDVSHHTVMHPKDLGESNIRKTLKNTEISTSTIIRKSFNPSTRNNKKLNKNSVSSDFPVPIWHWPTEGKIIENFSPSEGGNKGIDIEENKGKAIVATADGRVVYTGNALRGYGNLIIIKHKNDYLSAYAHNDKILVHEQQEVKAGQKIATMGSTGTNSTRLHFEIRHKGKSVNPIQYLPKR